MKSPSFHDWRDPSDRSSPMQMALDEALFEFSGESESAAARFYHWAEPATTIGYFEDQVEFTDSMPAPIRRLTGGGRVEHGEDLTFVLAFPRSLAICEQSNESRYHWIHSALAEALENADFPVHLEGAGHRQTPGPCFENPVTWDLLCPHSGIKIGGGAQRRTRSGVIHQGSVRVPESLRHPEAKWIADFLSRLADSISPLPQESISSVEKRAEKLLARRYGTASWNQGKEKKTAKIEV